MSIKPQISINVDATNPGQFFACCGLFELADRLWTGVEGWFVDGKFHITVPNGKACTLQELLTVAYESSFEIKPESDKSDGADVRPIELKVACLDQHSSLRLNWWRDKSIKPWAGSMDERLILHAMLRAIDIEDVDPLNMATAVYDPIEGSSKKGKKREPFYFDSRRAAKSHPLDSGWSPDTHKLEHSCFPAVEALCFIGLQRFRPSRTESPNTSCYGVWNTPLPVAVASIVTSGIARFPGTATWQFTNFFRTGERKHKAFGEAIQISTNERS